MVYKNIPITSLKVNHRNDRHAELAGEEEAAEWLLLHYRNRMLRLAEDIVDNAGLYEPPLVVEKHGSFIVFDGNRRTTCLKILSGAFDLPSTANRARWVHLRDRWNLLDIKNVECRVESNKTLVDQILLRRHTGAQEGIGQAIWDKEGVENFLDRTKQRTTKTPISQVLVGELRRGNHVKTSEKFARSKVDRLFSSNEFRRQVGFEIKAGQIIFLEPVGKNIKRTVDAIRYISGDAYTLADIWDKRKKQEFLDAFAKLNPDKVDDISTPTLSFSLEPERTSDSKRERKNENRPLRAAILLPWKNLDHNKDEKIDCVLLEIQSLDHIKFPIAFAALTRAFLDLLAKCYLVEFDPTKLDDLAILSNLIAACKNLEKRGVLPANVSKEMMRNIHNQQVLSFKTLNAYLHSAHAFPSGDHLVSVWKSLLPFIRALQAEVNR